MRHVTAFGRGAQSQAQGREGALSYQAIAGRGQVVTLVKHQHPETPQFARVDRSRIIRDDGNRLQFFLAATEYTYLAHIYRQGSRKRGAPLLQQVERRHNDQRPQPRLVQAHSRHEGLARARRQDHHARAASRQPVRHRLVLVRPRLDAQRRLERQSWPLLKGYMKPRSLLLQRAFDRREVHRLRAQEAMPFVALHTRRERGGKMRAEKRAK